ncbi:helix-turn-helix domain-containing protein [Paenibacillus cymbidii]|uniref:helix-turn-helix domain-containing protein n=1 Tax=Paenibacillus cymbidii TaxID=1639034 RepID=UPI001080C996|nr:AraC family transcriptional regulator [Paenibacillus cymbidii]
MVKFMDYMISPQPISIADLKVDKSKLSVKSLIITEMGHLPGRTLRRKQVTFDSWAFGYIAGGRGTYQVDGGIVQPVEKGSLFFVFPHAYFHYGPEEGGNWDEYYIRFEGSRVQEWLEDWLFQTETVQHVGWDEATIGKLELILMLMDSGVPSNADRASLLLESILFEWILQSRRSRQSEGKQRVTQLMLDISDTLFQPLDAAKLAARHHLSVPSLRRIISQYTGFPLNEYIHRLKIAEAKKLLVHTELQMKDISNALCYKDVFYFSRLFKKYVGVAPNVYRRNT